MKFNATFIKGLIVIDLDFFEDDRGWFARTFCKEEFKESVGDVEWVQINHSYSRQKGTLRGMHLQHPPFEEIKLIRCVAGKIYDVSIDLRKGSPTFLKWFGIELSAENKKMIYIPCGFAHGFLSLSTDCEIIYHHSNYYKPESEAGIKFDDPLININWPSSITEISDRDKNHPYLTDDFKGV